MLGMWSQDLWTSLQARALRSSNLLSVSARDGTRGGRVNFMLTFIVNGVPANQSVSTWAAAAVSRRLLGAEVSGTDAAVGLDTEQSRLVEIRFKAETVADAQEASLDALEAVLPIRFKSPRLRRLGVVENLLRG